MSVDLGPVRVLGADAVGQPGQRRFRLFALSALGSAIMWMEKEELANLSLALDQSLALLTEGQVLRTEASVGEQPEPITLPADFPRIPNYDFQVGQMKLSFDDRTSLFGLRVTPLEIVGGGSLEPHFIMREEESVSFFFTQQEAHELSRSITSIVTAGRPVCPLCHTPLDGGPHACIKQNGHREIIPIEGREEDE